MMAASKHLKTRILAAGIYRAILMFLLLCAGFSAFPEQSPFVALAILFVAQSARLIQLTVHASAHDADAKAWHATLTQRFAATEFHNRQLERQADELDFDGGEPSSVWRGALKDTRDDIARAVRLEATEDDLTRWSWVFKPRTSVSLIAAIGSDLVLIVIAGIVSGA